MFRTELSSNIDCDKEDLTFQVIDWYSEDSIVPSEDENDSTGNKHIYNIKAFGVDKCGRSVGLTITDYKPYFYIQVAKLDISIYQNFRLVEDYLNERYKKWFSIIGIERVSKINLYGFSNNTKSNFLKITFDNLKGFKSAVWNLKEIKKKFKVIQFESNIEPLLRFIHNANLDPSGWIHVSKGNYELNNEFLRANTNIDLITTYDAVHRIENSSLAPLLIASFDIECTSSHGDFPMAIKSYKKTARELFEFYKSLVSKRLIRREIQPMLVQQIYGLFKIDGVQETVLTYIIPKKKHVIDLDIIKTRTLERMDDIIKIMKDKPQNEKRISEFIDRDLKINDSKELIKVLKAKHEALTRFKKSTIEIEEAIMSTVFERYKDLENDSEYRMISKARRNSGIIMSLFDDDTVFDKISKELVKIGFPELEGDPLIQIGTTFHVYGQKECFFKHIITLDDCEDNFDVDEIISCQTEKQILFEWRKLILDMDPDIITGYNIYGFDNGYIRDRSIELKCSKIFEQLGRFKDMKYDEKKHPAFITKELQSSALGQNIMKYFAMEGRVQIDVMKVIQRDHKLDTYKLDSVASTFVNGKIVEIVNNNTLKIDNVNGLYTNNYIQLNDQKYLIKSICKDSKLITIDNTDAIDCKTWGMVKDDISPNEIFSCQKQGPVERAKIAKYCIQDCALCNYLIMKLEIVANNIGMSNVCLVPFSYIFLRGQGIKIFSLVAKQCLQDGFIIPVIRKVDEDELESYEGAIVLDPVAGIYEEPISVLDFASLYPSSMISENISHDSIVTDPKYDNLPGIEYNDIGFEVNGRMKNVRYAQFKDGEKGILPRILMKLLSQRKLTRKKILYKTFETSTLNTVNGMVTEDNEKYTTVKDLETNQSIKVKKRHITNSYDTYNEFEQAVLDGLQLAYKVTANSLYGQVGARTSPIFLQDLAASTTATGRNLVMKLKDFSEANFDCKVVYGDSVLPNTPIILKYNNEIHIKPIDKINELTHTCWESYDRFIKEGTNKEKSDLANIETWTHDGWKQIKKVIRHKCKKKIYRILTHTGLVDVTEDHSLLNNNLEQVKPSEVEIGSELFHLSPHIDKSSSSKHFTYEHLYVIGMFIGDGSCGQYQCKSGNKASWAINNKSLSLLEKCKKYLETIYENYEFIIYDTLKSSKVYKLCAKGKIKKLVAEWRKMCYEGDSKIIPKDAYFQEGLLDGLWDSDGCRKDFEKCNCRRIDTKNQLTAQSYYIYLSTIGYNVSVNTRKDKWNIFRLTFSKSRFKKNQNAIKKINLLYESYQDYVYDIETDAGTFQAGVGNMIVKNTDSIFLKFNSLKNDKGEELKGKERLQASIDKSLELSKAFKPTLKSPHDAEYEKTFWPFIILSKKRYVGNLYEEDVNKFKQKSMGIVLKRRDNANILKTVYGGMIQIILNEKDTSKAIKFLQSQLKLLEAGNVDIDDLIITKTLKSGYADPTKIAHKVLADRMFERDPGSAPQVNDRVPYVFIYNNSKQKILQGDRIEDPTYIKENKLKIDYAYYISNQIVKPVSQLLALVLESIQGFNKIKAKYNLELQKTQSHEKIALLKEKYVEKIIFEEVLMNIEKKQKKQRSITDFLPKP